MLIIETILLLIQEMYFFYKIVTCQFSHEVGTICTVSVFISQINLSVFLEVEGSWVTQGRRIEDENSSEKDLWPGVNLMLCTPELGSGVLVEYDLVL